MRTSIAARAAGTSSATTRAIGRTFTRGSSRRASIRRGCTPRNKRRHAMLERTPQQFRELSEITMQTDTRDILAHATRQAESHEDYFLVDMDAHVSETSFCPEILPLIDNDVIRQMGAANAARPGNENHSLLNHQPGILHQHLYGRIPHQQGLLEPTEKGDSHRFVQLARRAMNALGLDYQIVFPTPMLSLGMHPQDDLEGALGGAYNQWAGGGLLRLADT